MVFDPATQKMHCEYCGSNDSEEKKGDDSLIVCASCGGELTIDNFTSSSRCPYCNNYLVFDERVSGEYEPKMIIPFKLSKKKAVESMEKEFKKRVFAPISFLSEKSLVGMNGFYVPFFLYDYDANGEYTGEGTKVRRWSSGDYDYVETSYYRVKRKLHAKYDNIPVDASYAMPDAEMDLLEPFDYNMLEEFDPKVMSGFYGEIFNDPADAFEGRARSKAMVSAHSIIKESLAGYTTLKPFTDRLEVQNERADYVLLPVWLYIYQFGGKTYRYYVNGVTGKVVGVTPVSKLKVFLYGLTCSAMWFLIAKTAFWLAIFFEFLD